MLTVGANAEDGDYDKIRPVMEADTRCSHEHFDLQIICMCLVTSVSSKMALHVFEL
jgi:hypothetical protein